jgi:hypothetical protein
VWLERRAQDRPNHGARHGSTFLVEGTVKTVIIGIDPHKLSHAVCAIDEKENARHGPDHARPNRGENSPLTQRGIDLAHVSIARRRP